MSLFLGGAGAGFVYLGWIVLRHWVIACLVVGSPEVLLAAHCREIR